MITLLIIGSIVLLPLAAIVFREYRRQRQREDAAFETRCRLSAERIKLKEEEKRQAELRAAEERQAELTATALEVGADRIQERLDAIRKGNLELSLAFRSEEELLMMLEAAQKEARQ